MAIPINPVDGGTDGINTATPTFPVWPANETGDHVFVFAINDGGTTAISSLAGWTEHYNSASSISGTRSALWSRKNTGTPITAPTLTGQNDEWALIAFVVRDADDTTLLDAAVAVNEYNTTSFVGVSFGA